MQSKLDEKGKANYTDMVIKNATERRHDKKLKTRIQELRKQRRLSQEDLAMAVGVTRQTITSLECEKYTASLVLAYRISTYFGLTIEEVFDFTHMEEM